MIIVIDSILMVVIRSSGSIFHVAGVRSEDVREGIWIEKKSKNPKRSQGQTFGGLSPLFQHFVVTNVM